MAFIREGRLIFARNVSQGARIFDQQISGMSDLAAAQAEALKVSKGNLGPVDDGDEDDEKRAELRAAMRGAAGQFSNLITYTFFDKRFDLLHRADERVGEIMSYFTLLAIFIACLGLFGLASFTTQQRTKEIGIRKVLGSSASQIILLISKEFTKLVLLALIIAIPLAYFGMQQWLNNFAYRTEIGVTVFLFASGLTLFLALFTISFQTIRAALTKPADALRYE